MKLSKKYKKDEPIAMLCLSTVWCSGLGLYYIQYFGRREANDFHKESVENFLIYLKYRRRK